MNERIKELAEQAKQSALDAMIKITDKEQALKVYSESYDTKFAELIVRDCLDIVDRHEYSYHEADPLWETAQLIKEHFGVDAQLIKEHFGVE
jgi:hypothetical protein